MSDAQRPMCDPESASRRALAKRAYRKAHVWRTWAIRCVHSRKERGIAFTLTADDLESLARQQNHRCALTGLRFWQSDRKQNAASWDSPTLDRIIAGGPYEAGNVRIVLHCVNTFRGQMTDAQMISVARSMIRVATLDARALPPLPAAGSPARKTEPRLCRVGGRETWHIYDNRKRISTGCTDRNQAVIALSRYVQELEAGFIPTRPGAFN